MNTEEDKKMEVHIDKIFDEFGVAKAMEFIRSCWGAMILTGIVWNNEFSRKELEAMKTIVKNLEEKIK